MNNTKTSVDLVTNRNIYLEGGKLVKDSQSSKKNMASEKLEKIQKRNLM